MNHKIRHLFCGGNILLWMLITITTVLYGGQLFGIDWELTSKKTSGRLLEHTYVAVIEVSLAILLLLIQVFTRSRPNWFIVTIGIFVAGVAFYHLSNYYVGTEMFLLWASGWLIREYGRKA